MDGLIRAEKISLAYGDKTVLAQLSFEIPQGHYVALVGPNGAGKTTLVNALLGLHKPSEGKVWMDAELSKGYAYLTQLDESQRQFPASVEEVVCSGAQTQGLEWFRFHKTLRQKARAQLERLGIESLAKRLYSTLSGGQKQRVRLARSLMNEVSLLILDEPENGLDPMARQSLYEALAQLNDVTILHITHQLPELKANVNQVLHLDRTLQFDGTPEAYFAQPFAQAYWQQRGGQDVLC